MKVPCVLTIAGSDSGGGAGIQADIKTMAALGVHGLCAITAVTAQNTLGVEAVMEMPPEFVAKQIDVLMEDFEVKFAKTGMLSSADIIRVVASRIKKYHLRVVVDPIIISASGSPLMREGALSAMKELLSCAELVTPNVHEAERLSGLKIKSIGDMKRAAKKIAGLGPKAVLIKGGHLMKKTVTDILYQKGRFEELSGTRLTEETTHGTGCSLSSAIAAELAKGASLSTAVRNARAFVIQAIQGRLKLGHGVVPVNQMAGIFREVETARALGEVWKAAQLLVKSPKFVKLIPEVGTNIVMALPGAKSRSEVVGLSGRIVRTSNGAVLTGFPELGGSEHMANAVLTAHRFNPRILAAMNIKFSEETLRLCQSLGLSISSFDRIMEPKGVKTMEWGTEQAIKKAGTVPQVIYDRGGLGKEAMIRLLGPTPSEVAHLALKIAEKVS
ncbi:MAG: bifunctional hydroxymethylpyrimidine kinase/phosphomethylpyrimidine kinase [Candidatus Hadarchaeum sp.]|uniref:bifunctional hydroxymethylpyrimidine kinase/phosphomethylpyrimidine kinase n=1 Tax=Candidatus Hadarchaeum sp. TaxID=2883567 RepID=UPI003D0C6014